MHVAYSSLFVTIFTHHPLVKIHSFNLFGLPTSLKSHITYPHAHTTRFISPLLTSLSITSHKIYLISTYLRIYLPTRLYSHDIDSHQMLYHQQMFTVTIMRYSQRTVTLTEQLKILLIFSIVLLNSKRVPIKNYFAKKSITHKST